MMTKARIAATAAVLTAGIGLAGLGGGVAQAAPTVPLPDYHWCPGEFWHPEWGFNWGGNRCHDDFYFDGEARDRGHWHGRGDWRPGF